MLGGMKESIINKKMATEKQEEIIRMLKDMEEIMRTKGYLPVVESMKFLDKGFSISERFREMQESRDKWKARALKAEKELKDENKR